MLCSKEEDKYKCIEYISEKLLNGDFKQEEVENTKKRILLLKQSDIICPRTSTKKTDECKTLTFVINRNDFMVKKIKELLKECQTDIESLLGKTKIIVAERRNGNIASTVFAKSSFSRNEDELKKIRSVMGRVVSHVN